MITRPEWWNLFAELTGWIHWPAWAAILSFAALLNTARLADRGRRDDRQKSAAFLVAVAIILEASITAARQCWVEIDGGKDTDTAAAPVNKTNAMLSLSDQLSKLDATDFPNPNSLAIFMAARVKLKTLEMVLDKLSTGESSPQRVRDLVCDV